MKAIKYILAALLLLVFTSCKEEVQPYDHTDVEITALIAINPVSGEYLDGVISQNEGTIVFKVPRADADKFDLTKMKLQATVFFDALITPKLDGLFDITKDEEQNPRLKLTVTSMMHPDDLDIKKEYLVYGYVSAY